MSPKNKRTKRGTPINSDPLNFAQVTHQIRKWTDHCADMVWQFFGKQRSSVFAHSAQCVCRHGRMEITCFFWVKRTFILSICEQHASALLCNPTDTKANLRSFVKCLSLLVYYERIKKNHNNICVTRSLFVWTNQIGYRERKKDY